MSAINKPKKNPSVVTKSVSYNGNPQFVKSPEMELYGIMVTTMYGKDSYYETVDERVDRLYDGIYQVVKHGNLDFIANAIMHARTEMHIRTMPLMGVVLFAKALRKQNKTYAPLRRLVRNVIQRADQLTDMYAAALLVFEDKKAVPMAIKRGVADACNKFDEYQFAKYNRKGAVKMRDVLRIVHPKPKNNLQGELFQKIMDDTLETPYTWETTLSMNGSLPEKERKSNKELWTELIQDNALGYMALLRNLRNILQAGVDDNIITLVTSKLTDSKEVANSKQLPFRFLNAYHMVNAVHEIPQNQKNNILNALRTAMDLSLSNVQSIGDNVWIIIDCSGSMMGGYYGAAGSIVSPFETATLFASALIKSSKDSQNVAVTMFSDYAKHVYINPHDSLFTIVDAIKSEIFGYGTNFENALNMKKTLGFEPDTVIIISDMQMNRLSFNTKNIDIFFDQNAIKVAIDMVGYGNAIHAKNNKSWWQMVGWSERIFDFIPALRNGETIVDKLSDPF